VSNLSLWFLLVALIYSVFSLVLTLVSVAIYTLAERKIMASIQRRKGPNLVGIWGLLQPIADGFKLIIKNKVNPKLAKVSLFNFAPVLILAISLVS
jgi:NADH-ubiquinone oxidoreductase chain 1